MLQQERLRAPELVVSPYLRYEWDLPPSDPGRADILQLIRPYYEGVEKSLAPHLDWMINYLSHSPFAWLIDIDGTCIDSHKDIYQSVVGKAKALGIGDRMLPLMTIMEQFDGRMTSGLRAIYPVGPNEPHEHAALHRHYRFKRTLDRKTMLPAIDPRLPDAVRLLHLHDMPCVGAPTGRAAELNNASRKNLEMFGFLHNIPILSAPHGHKGLDMDIYKVALSVVLHSKFPDHTFLLLDDRPTLAYAFSMLDNPALLGYVYPGPYTDVNFAVRHCLPIMDWNPERMVDEFLSLKLTAMERQHKAQKQRRRLNGR